MEFIRGLHNLRPEHRGCVATIGNFDGVHLGHQAVLGELAEKAAQLRLPTTAIVFEPQPQEYFAGDRAPARLMRLREKLQAFQRLAVDRVLCLFFNESLAAMPAEDFIRRVLIDGLDVRYLAVGSDFRFGHRRTGDIEALARAGDQCGFQVAAMHTVSIDGARVSSTRIRQALAAGDLAAAEKLLGRPYRMSGRVVHGDKRGRVLGVPTANIYLHRRNSPVHGVYAVEVFGVPDEPRPGAANVGTRPTVGGTRTLLEVHILDFDGSLYGQHVRVDFLHKIRDEERFASLEILKEYIQRDIEQTRDFFSRLAARR
ncbi:MAG TPA: bifunctional riboflavin kinase/FAD synthetase [Gammaproteobacteria bacterium]|nr:bifunctional riboflavin kinase/FAD synthetase [Gammaproteobacteria bacterium]